VADAASRSRGPFFRSCARAAASAANASRAAARATPIKCARLAATANPVNLSSSARNTMPQRIQRKRIKGWRMPANAVYVGRPTKWGNPYYLGSLRKPGGELGMSQVIENYRHWILGGGVGKDKLDPKELRGKDLACWCPLDQPCHADVLLELANA
jgi:hypothetical protein